MPREPRIYVENVLYLVIAKGDEDCDLFCDAHDYRTYLQALSEYKREHGFRLFAYTLLPKSLYLLIELKNNVTISSIMHDLNANYTKAYNSRYDKKGHLFRSRFKSILIEKEDYLLRMSRYIHLLSKDSGTMNNPMEYPFSSCFAYLPEDIRPSLDYAGPDMADEIKEVLAQFTQMETPEDQRGAYEEYVRCAKKEEVELVEKLLHRKAFVGSSDFVEEIQKEIEQHIIDEEEARTIRKTRPELILAGGLIILLLGFAAYNFYHTQSDLQKSLDRTANGFATARQDLAGRVTTLRSELTQLTDEKYHGLNGLVWEVEIRPLVETDSFEPYVDQLVFDNGRVTSRGLEARGFSPLKYTVTPQSHGRVAWETARAEAGGMTVSWRGVYTGKKLRGILNESPAQGQSRDFSFVSLRQVSEPGRVENAIQ